MTPRRRLAAIVAALLLVFALGLRIGSCDKAPQPGPNGASGAGEGGDDEPEVWTCSMHPQVKLPEPGPCPICGMDLIPLRAGDEQPLASTHVALSERAKALARIRTVPVRRGASRVELRLLGRLEADQTRLRTITPWIGGRIDELYVSAVGVKIRRGQRVARLYSPQVYAAQQDLIAARRQLEALGPSSLQVAGRTAREAVQAVRQRLSLLGLPDKTVDAMAREQTARHHVTVRSPYAGTVLEQLVNEGAYVEPGSPLYRVADLARLWVQIDAYESDLALISLGQRVTLEVASYPGETFEGRVSFIDPIVDRQTRTAQIRVEVSNRRGRLSPGMFAEAVVHAPEGLTPEIPLVVPRTAPLFTGRRSLVYVELAGRERPTYEAREVQLGPRAGEVFPVVSGLEEGERVVVQGAFAIDAELQIRGGQSMMAQDDDVMRQARQPLEVPRTFVKGIAPIVGAYLALQEQLAADALAAARQAAATLAQKVTIFEPKAPAQARRAWSVLQKPLLIHATQLAKADSLERARQVFEPASQKMIETLQRFGNPLEAEINLAFCPMAGTGGKGAYWIQRASDVQNPYYGARMYRCGEIKRRLATGQRPDLSSQATGPRAEEAPSH